jgi:hypothetical protein
MGVVTHNGLQHALFFACIAPNGGTLTGSYGIDRRVVVPHGAQAVLCWSLNRRLEDSTAAAQQVASALAIDMQDTREVPPALY